MWRDASAIAFWAALGLTAYTYLIYPLLLTLAARGKKRTPPAEDANLPRLSLLIAAHNEERFIARRIENALAMDYPADRLEVVVASDGSSDRTDELVRNCSDPRVRLLPLNPRRGKAVALNTAIPGLSGEIVALSDANTFYEPGAARKLARWFRDESLGSVVGKLILIDPQGASNVDGAYWKYETFLKTRESRLGALLGANGAIYAIRKGDYVSIPDNTIVDDFVIPLMIALRTGKKVIYDTEAVAREETPETIGSEFRRRSRIGAGGFQAIGLLWPLLNPRRGWISWTFLSHKVLRWAVPFLMILMLATSATLAIAGERTYQAMLGLQVAFYALALGAAFTPAEGKAFRLMRISTMFVAMNLALLAGFWRWARGLKSGTWARTARSGEGAA